MNNLTNYRYGDKEIIETGDLITIKSQINPFHNGVSGQVQRIATISNPYVSVCMPDNTYLAFDVCELELHSRT